MGITVVAEELPAADELEELYRLDASEPAPENEDDDEDTSDDGEDDDGENEDRGGFKPGEMPHP